VGVIKRPAFSLDDRFDKDSGVIFLSGIQALARLLLVQQRRDARAGRRTGGFVSGYRGSPLGGLDQVLWRERQRLEAHHIVFQPGVNEELAATAVWGSQQVGLFPGATVEGVFGLWYGKAPGLDRASDAIRHANAAGTSAQGGVLLVVGDDHGCKSSTLPSHSELTLKDLGIPVLNPANVQDVLDYGIFGWAMSRYSGCWSGLIALADTMDSAATVWLEPDPVPFVCPEHDRDVHMTTGRAALEQEALLHGVKLPLALAFARANGINRTIANPERASVGIVTTGKAYLDARQALTMLGFPDAAALTAAGIRLMKLGMSWPLDAEEMAAFAAGLDTIVVVEEKRPFVEPELKDLLYAHRTLDIVGKRTMEGETLLPSSGELTVAMVARALARYLPQGAIDRAYIDRVNELGSALAGVEGQAKTDRLPMFCAGCPHNTSTRVPEGSRASAGIGCHYMAQWMDRDTATFTQMGGEGISWTGQAPFTDERHIFVNLGDGTYFHSGVLAIRQAVSSGANVTYKILLNDAVAMTGGQPIDGQLSVQQLVDQVRAEGVEHIEVLTDDVGALERVDVPVHPRDDLDRVQRRFRELPGCSVLIYQQTCATELRRRRKRGLADDPPMRVMINDAVCEGCGDCSVRSNCVAVEPLETGQGLKRQINQTACNKDLSCLKGFCPAFVLVEGGGLRQPRGVDVPLAEVKGRAPLPEPSDRPANLLIAGVGGTGVVTVSALLGTAAHLDGRAVSTLDMTGLAQKGGAVFGHVRIAKHPEELDGSRVAAGQADLLLGCDLVTAASTDALTLMDDRRTLTVVNTDVVPTAEFVLHQDADHHESERLTRIERFSRHTLTVDGGRMTGRLLGSTATLNVFLLGYAYQQGVIPISVEGLERAIELNGTAVAANLKAFHFGRIAACDPASLADDLEAGDDLGRGPMDPLLDGDLETLMGERVKSLTAYQGIRLAERYEQFVRRVQAAEAALDRSALTRTVASSYAKLLAYKDEYEVARLYSDGRWAARLARTFEGDYRLRYLLAPPLLGRKKRRFGPWMSTLYRVLARLRFLRGTPFDPFGYLAERRRERWSIRHFESVVGELLAGLDGGNHGLAVQIAALPEGVRGYGHIKEAARARWLAEESRLLDEFRRPPAPVRLADQAHRSAA
jgi:indolepyruvate ferredoxin oxidoreductase